MSTEPEDHDAALLRRIADDVIDDLLSTPRDLRRQEVQENHGDHAAVVREMRAVIDAALDRHGKKRAAELRQQIDRGRQAYQPMLRAMSIEEKRALYARIANSNAKLTMAARDGREVTDGDLDTYLEAWLAVGVIDEDGNLR